MEFFLHKLNYILLSSKSCNLQIPLIRVKRSPPASHRARFRENRLDHDDDRDRNRGIMRINDPMWGKMWYLNRDGVCKIIRHLIKLLESCGVNLISLLISSYAGTQF